MYTSVYLPTPLFRKLSSSLLDIDSPKKITSVNAFLRSSYFFTVITL